MCREPMPLETSDFRRAMAAYPQFPFCSQRCKMTDLGHWFQEDYKIQRPVQEEDLPDSLDEDLGATS